MSDLPTGRQLRIARAALGLSPFEVAQFCNLGIADIVLAEDGISNDEVLLTIRRALESCGIEFGPEGWVRYRSDATPESAAPRHCSEVLDIKHGKPLARSIGSASKRARKAMGLTQEEASEKLGISVQHFARIERGASLPSIATLFVIVQAFGLDLDGLLRGKDVTPSNPMVATYQEFSVPAFGALCRKARDGLVITQEDVSSRIGVSPEFYSRIERGQIAPSLSVLYRLVHVLELNVNELLRPNYVEAFERLWGTARDVFEGVPRDERGIPVVEDEEG